MKIILPFILLLVLIKRTISLPLPLIVPQELPSILSLVYSNIPPIKKGTDSRVGFGFRLGDHADFQIMYELGPQIYTKKIGDQSSNDRRRFADPEKKPSDNSNKTWLQRWAQEQAEERKAKLNSKKASSKQRKPSKPTVAPEVMDHLRQLYGEKSSTSADDSPGTLPGAIQVEAFSTSTVRNVQKITENLADIEFD